MYANCNLTLMVEYRLLVVRKASNLTSSVVLSPNFSNDDQLLLEFCNISPRFIASPPKVFKNIPVSY